MLELHASQSVTLAVAPNRLPIRHYLRQPQRLVYALMNPNQVTTLGQGVFRLHLRSLQFMMIRIQPVVDVAVRSDGEGRVQLTAVGCQLQGNEFMDKRFDLALDGYLQPQGAGSTAGRNQGKTRLEGQADLTIRVDLPLILAFTPRSLLEMTGNQLLRGVLMTIKQRLLRQLAQDYARWSQEQDAAIAGPLGSVAQS